MNKINKLQIKKPIDIVISDVLELLKSESFYVHAILILLFGNLSLLKCWFIFEWRLSKADTIFKKSQC